ncbi:MAG TPA: response regulator transcription factor [Acidimicrobiales bacterium]|jgi:two-component system nitrate/nitrite response regulator NarL
MDLTVALAAGPEVVRRGLEVMLGALDGVSWRSYRTAEEVVVGAIATGWAQVSLVEAADLRRLRPDARDVLARTRVVAMVPSLEPSVLSVAVQCSADGYVVLPELSIDSLDRALHDVASGARHLPDPISSFLLTWVQAGSSDVAGRAQLLSAREREVLELLVAGLSNKEISRELGISLHGAKRHVSSILNKLDSPSRSHVVSTVLRSEAAWDQPTPSLS